MTERIINAATKFSNYVEILNVRASLQTNDTAFVFINSPESKLEVTFGQLHTKAAAIAAELQKYNPDGERALLLYRPGIDFIVAFFSCLYAKVIPVPVHPVRNQREISRLSGIVENAQIKFVLTTEDSIVDFQKIYSEIPYINNARWIATNSQLEAASRDWKMPAIQGTDIAFLQYTSGSTGQPKGVIVTHSNLIHNQQAIKQGFQHSQETIFVGWLPLYHDMGLIGNVLQPLYLGIKSVLFPPFNFLQSPAIWLKTISEYRATTSGGPNFAYELCVNKITDEEIKDIDLSSWKIAFNGAEPVKANVIESFINRFKKYGFKAEVFYPCYGMAETTLFVSGGNPQDKPVLLPVDEQELENHRIKVVDNDTKKVLIGCGNVHGEHDVRIVNPETHTLCSLEEIGEIWIAGGSVAAGYWNVNQQTQETFQAYLTTGEGPYLRTGDFGFFVERELFITGRLKDLIIIRGLNHYPDDIENTVEKSNIAIRPGGTAAFTVDVNGDANAKLVVVCEIKKDMLNKVDNSQLLAIVRKNISDVHGLRLHDLVLIMPGTLPKTSSGKKRRRHCTTLYLQNGFREAVARQLVAVEKLESRLG
ncbi:fatty acyl-AMP ligase [Nostoc sp.]|uniref:fatty acyl-AMP ligase n=1 Tax=Nostoc sp. TaxID=1180 RepID=UPI002FF4846A